LKEVQKTRIEKWRQVKIFVNKETSICRSDSEEILSGLVRIKKKKSRANIEYKLGKNRIEVSNLKNRTIPYSPTKIKANSPLEYSVLKPETNSDSPSEKSKGARLHSAIHDRNQIIRMGKVMRMKEDEESLRKSKNEKNLLSNKTQKIIREREIS